MNTIRIGIIGGSGVGTALVGESGQPQPIDTPFGPPSAPPILTQWQGVDVVILPRHGQGHVFNPSRVPYRANIFALKALGVTHIIASGATGSLREDIHPGDLVVVDQVIDKTFARANTFYDHAAVHVEFAEPFCPVMRKWLLAAAGRMEEMNKQNLGVAEGGGENPPPRRRVRVHDGGTYVCMEGPAFSTRAESHLHRALGGTLIGMTCMPEAKLAREAEIAYALIGLPTDYDCWKPAAGGDVMPLILKNLQNATQRSIELIRAALSDVELLRATPSPAHEALKLGIWTNKSMIDPNEIERLRVLWGRYF